MHFSLAASAAYHAHIGHARQRGRYLVVGDSNLPVPGVRAGGNDACFGNAGGIADPGNMTVNYGGMTLTITDDAPWQQLWGGTVPGERLAEAIASGDSRYNMGKAGPRPFHQEAERQFAGSGEFDRLLAQGLRAHGFVLK